MFKSQGARRLRRLVVGEEVVAGPRDHRLSLGARGFITIIIIIIIIIMINSILPFRVSSSSSLVSLSLSSLAL